MLHIVPLPAFDDNYIWIIHHDRHAVIVDPGDAAPVLGYLRAQSLTPVAVLATHHHGDHTGGVADLLARFPMPVYGPPRPSLPEISHPLTGGERIDFPELPLSLDTLALPGHTRDHVGYYGANSLFCGDTLFSCGCGRLFEGTPAQMVTSLHRILRLPDDTRIYCAHEYTLENLRFANRVEPGNLALAARTQEAQAQRQARQPTVPTTLGMERRTNPFLRFREAAVIAAASRHAGRPLTDEVATFAETRRWKDEIDRGL